MKLYIGTLYSQENEFDACVESIQSQVYRNFDHVVIRDLPEREAHTRLFRSFLAEKNNYDLLIKIDADMVLTRNDLFERIIDKFSSCSGLEVFSIAVFDFFSGQLVNGLNTYRNTVRWDFEKDTLFVDIPETSKEHYLYDTSELAPAAIHCKNPSPLQAFHYGVHRGLKSIALVHSTTHWGFLEKVWLNFLKTADVRIGLAVLGAELVYAGRLAKAQADYTHPGLQAAFEIYQHLDADAVRRQVLRLRLRNWGWLPGDMRRRCIRNLRGKYL